MSEESGQRREAGGNCQLPAESFKFLFSGTPPCLCKHHFFGHIYICVLALSKAVCIVKSLYACLLGSSVSHGRVGHFGSRTTVSCQTHLHHNRTMSRYTCEHGRTLSTRSTITLGGASGAPAEILLNMRDGTISGMRVSPTTLSS